MRTTRIDLQRILKDYGISEHAILTLSDCFSGGVFDTVDEVVECIDDLIIELKSINEKIYREAKKRRKNK